jgi:hypothetical protein
MRVLPLAAGLLAGVATLSAQPAGTARTAGAPRAAARRRAAHGRARRRRDGARDGTRDGERDHTIRRFAPDGMFAGPATSRCSASRGASSGAASSPRARPGRGPRGCAWTRSRPDGPAARAGIAAGDRLVAVNGVPLRVERDDVGDPLLSAVPDAASRAPSAAWRPGARVELRYTRDGRERSARLRTVAPDAVADLAPGRPGDRSGERGPDLREFRRELRRIDPGDGSPGDRSGPRVEFFARATTRAPSSGAAAPARSPTAPAPGPATARCSASPWADGGARDTLGIFVSAVAPGGPAERAGVVEGDRVAAVNTVDLRVPREERDDPEAAAARRARFTRELARVRPGDRVSPAPLGRRALAHRHGHRRPRGATSTAVRGCWDSRRSPGAGRSTASCSARRRGSTWRPAGRTCASSASSAGRDAREFRVGPELRGFRVGPGGEFRELRELREPRELRGLRARARRCPPAPPRPPRVTRRMVTI